jgi:hypothetical protein
MPLASWRLNGLAKPSSEVATGMYVQNSVTSIASQSVTIPTVLTGDVGIFFATCTTTGNSGSTPSGWTLILQGSLSYSFRVSYKQLTSSDSGTTLSSGIASGSRSNILLIVRGISSGGADAVIPSGFTVSPGAGQTTTATPSNQTVSLVASNAGAIGFGMWASNGTITARGFAANYGNTPTTPQLNEYSSSTGGINLYVKALTSYLSSTGANTTTRRDNILFSMADYGSNGTLVFYMQLPAPTGSRTARPQYSPYKTNSPALTTSNYQFGTASLNVQLSASPIRNTNCAGLSSNPYTFEWWGYQTTNPTNSPAWFDHTLDATQTGGPIVFFGTSAGITLGVIANQVTRITGVATPSLNAWHHYALVREGTGTNQLKFYIDGALVGTNTDAANYGVTAATLTIGGLNFTTDPTGSQSGPFLIDEFRVSNTARYTAAFTPPTAAFTNDANTLELYHFDGANGSYYLPDDNA